MSGSAGSADVLVVGGGIVGAATAYFLARRGFKTLLLEGRSWAWGASGRNPGFQWLHTRKAGLQMELAMAGRRLSDRLAEELDGFKVRTRAQKIHVAETNSNLALELAQSQIMYGDWREWFRDLERVQAIRVEDLKAAMEKTLVKSNRTVGMIVNAKPETGAGGGR